jgi:hypothetical protein
VSSNSKKEKEKEEYCFSKTTRRKTTMMMMISKQPTPGKSLDERAPALTEVSLSSLVIVVIVIR